MARLYDEAQLQEKVKDAQQTLFQDETSAQFNKNKPQQAQQTSKLTMQTQSNGQENDNHVQKKLKEAQVLSSNDMAQGIQNAMERNGATIPPLSSGAINEPTLQIVDLGEYTILEDFSLNNSFLNADQLIIPLLSLDASSLREHTHVNEGSYSPPQTIAHGFHSMLLLVKTTSLTIQLQQQA